MNGNRPRRSLPEKHCGPIDAAYHAAKAQQTQEQRNKPQQLSSDIRCHKTFKLLRQYYWMHLVVIVAGTWFLTFVAFKNFYDRGRYIPPFHHIAWILPFPYTLSSMLGLFLKYDDPKEQSVRRRFFRRLFIVVVTKGSNREAVYRSWNALKDLRDSENGVELIVVSDEPHLFYEITNIAVPRSFVTHRAKFKARALEYFRKTMRLTDKDWVLHLDEESTIDQNSLYACIDFIERTDYSFGQGIILYNQFEYWKRPLLTMADAIRVGDDLGRFHLQYKIFHRPIFGAHGSFLLTNGALENEITWEIAGMTEDFEFALNAWIKGHRCGEILGLVREQSPQTILDFLKQRRRWFVGIQSVRHPIARYLVFQWICGILCGVVTTLNFLLQALSILRSPFWVGMLGNFSFVVFVYLYVIGIVVQDFDYGYSSGKILVHVLCTIVFQPVSAILECLSVLYGLVVKPRDFEVIAK